MAEMTTKVFISSRGTPFLSSFSDLRILQYVLDKVKPDVGSEPVEPTKVDNPQSPPPVVEKTVDTAAIDDVEKSTEEANNDVEEIPEAGPENTSASTNEEPPADEEPEEKEIVLSTAPADYRFPTTNQSRHCFTRYIEYHRCIAAKGEGASDCDKFAKYYRALCPGEWVGRWNEQRENGTFPGPL